MQNYCYQSEADYFPISVNVLLLIRHSDLPTTTAVLFQEWHHSIFFYYVEFYVKLSYGYETTV